MKIASYNIRKAVGLDWRRDAGRILRVLAEIDADIVVLQEADKRLGHREGVLPVEQLGRELGYEFADYGKHATSHGWHGNAILFRKQHLDLSVVRKLPLPTLEPRGAIAAVFTAPRFEVVGVHLGLTPGIRKQQLQRLNKHLARVDHPVLIAGDMNSRLPDQRIGQLFQDPVQVIAPGATFHAAYPFASFDRFIAKGFTAQIKCSVHNSELARRASDHLPIIAEIEVSTQA